MSDTTFTYNVARHLMTDYGINVFENRLRWKQTAVFCDSWKITRGNENISDATFMLANSFQKEGQI